MRSNIAGKVPSQVVLVSVIVLLNRVNCWESDKTTPWMEVKAKFFFFNVKNKQMGDRSYGPLLRKTLWIISNLQAIMIQVLVPISLCSIWHLV